MPYVADSMTSGDTATLGVGQPSRFLKEEKRTFDAKVKCSKSLDMLMSPKTSLGNQMGRSSFLICVNLARTVASKSILAAGEPPSSCVLPMKGSAKWPTKPS